MGLCYRTLTIKQSTLNNWNGNPPTGNCDNGHVVPLYGGQVWYEAYTGAFGWYCEDCAVEKGWIW